MLTYIWKDDIIFKSPTGDIPNNENLKTFKKCLTIFDEDGIIKKSSEMNDTMKRNKKFRKKFKKCLTERDRHDKLIKSPKQGDTKFFEN